MTASSGKRKRASLAWTAVGAVIVGIGAFAGFALGTIGCLGPETPSSQCTPTTAGWLLIAASIVFFPACLLAAGYLARRRLRPWMLLIATVVLALAALVGNIYLWGHLEP
jgi:cyanate permease